jgi:transcriptional regulator with XRE-family HTH domain
VTEQAGVGFGGLLRQLRAEAGLTQDELAEAARVSQRAVSDLERGINRTARNDTAVLLAGTLGLDGPARPVRRSARGRGPAADVLAETGDGPAGGKGPAGPGEVVVPQQLPTGVGYFAGRDSELRALDELAGQPRDQGRPGAVVVTAAGGMARIGKTALAVHWARQVADRFPDGQLYVNLRGYDPDGEPLAAEVVTGWFLAALGVPAPAIPADAQARAGLYRSVLASRRVLIVLDNARDAAQVRPLLAGGPGCLAVVTSRSTLAGLAAIDAARLVSV